METLVYDNQDTYYAQLRQADKKCDATPFIEFLLDIMLKTIDSYSLTEMSDKVSDKLSNTEKQAYDIIITYLGTHESVSNQTAQQLLKKSAPTVRRYLSTFVEHELLQTIGEKKSRVYIKTTQNK